MWGTLLCFIFPPANDKEFSSSNSDSELISSSAKAVDELITGLSKDGAPTPALQLPCLQSIVAARDELHSALQGMCTWNQQTAESRISALSDRSNLDENLTKESVTTHSTVKKRVISKMVHTFPPGLSSTSSSHWV